MYEQSKQGKKFIDILQELCIKQRNKKGEMVLLNKFKTVLKPEIFHKFVSEIRKYDINRISCLEQSFIKLNMPIKKIQRFRTMYKMSKNGKFIKTVDLNTICKKLKIKIKLNKLRITPTLNKKTGNMEHQTDILHYGTEGKEYPLALYEKHYFADCKTDYTKFSIEIYDEICNRVGFKYIKERNGKGFKKLTKKQRDNKEKLMPSVRLIRYLLKNKDTLLQKIDKSSTNIYNTIYNQKVDDFETLEICEQDYRKNEVDVDRKLVSNTEGARFDVIVYFDFEATTNTEIHKCYQIVYKYRGDPNNGKYKFEGSNCAKNFLEDLAKRFDGKSVLCKAHNLRYDIQFIVKHLFNLHGFIKTGTKIKNICANYYNKKANTKVKLIFKDTYSFIQMGLKKFHKCFNIKAKKEVMPYEVYTENSVKLAKYPIETALKYIEDEEDKKQFIKNIDEWNLRIEETYFNHLKYSLIYCGIDVDVLKQGDEMFREWMIEATGIDLDRCISLPQIANLYGHKEGVFTDVYELSGVVREFIQRCVEGGRVMTKANKKLKVKYDEEKKEDMYYEDYVPAKSIDYNKRVFEYEGHKFNFSKYDNITKRLLKDFIRFCDKKKCPITMKETINMFSKLYIKKEHRKECYKIIKKKLKECIEKFISKGKLKNLEASINNKKIEVHNCKLQDFDAVSLYPSAMYRLGEQYGGLLKGTPKPFNNTYLPEMTDIQDIDSIIHSYTGDNQYLSYKDLKKMDGYFVQINITKVNKHFDFPLISRKDEGGIRRYTNTTGEMYVDKFKLEDMIKYQDIEFKILRGYYFNEGRNPKISAIMKHLFNQRLYHKGKHDKNGNKLPKEQWRKKNPIQEVYKLIMNSFYGKLIMKPIDKKYIFVNTKRKLLEYLSYHKNSITFYSQISKKLYMVEERKGINTHYSMPHCGTEILSLSKRIMNEVMCLAEDNDIRMFYTDTDSIHIDDGAVKHLSELFRNKENRELIGDRLGQFHCDFNDTISELSNDNKQVKSEIKPYSIEAYFLGKKSYIDKLVLTKDGKEYIQYHIRLKGVPNKCINKYDEQEDVFDRLHNESTPINLYNKMFRGQIFNFDLSKCIKFKSNINFTTSNYKTFNRTISFPDRSYLVNVKA